MGFELGVINSVHVEVLVGPKGDVYVRDPRNAKTLDFLDVW